jgi:proteasome accessory factor B
MDRLERLVNLVAALIDAERPLSREAIHRKVGGYAVDADAFRRNFERDKDLLRQMGFPLVLEPLDGQRPDGPIGYRIPRERYELPDPGLDPDELAALHLAASSVSVDAGWSRDAGTTALRKLAATTGLGAGATPGLGAVQVTPRGSPQRQGVAADLATDERVAIAFGALSDRQAVRFSYRGTLRHLDPWHLSFRRGHWYLSGRDHGRHTERMFRLDRVEGRLELHGEPGAFTRPDAGAAPIPPPWRIGEDDDLVADLWVDELQADWTAGELGADTVSVRSADGSARFAVRVTNRAAFRTFVLGLLDHAEIIGPPELRTDMVSWLESQAAGRP